MSDDEPLSSAAKRFKYCCNDSLESNDEFNITDLPHEILVYIFTYLDFTTVAKCSMICKKFYEVCNDHGLYKDVFLKYDMNTNLMTSYINKISYPKHINIEYKSYDADSALPNYSEFDEYVTWLIRKCSEHITSITLENCHNEHILILLCECRKLMSITCLKCKGNFDALPTLKNLVKIAFTNSDIPHRVLNDTLQNNPILKTLFLYDNAKLNTNDLCFTISRHNYHLEYLHIRDKRRVRAKGLKGLSRCTKLKVLELLGTPFACDPEDSLQLLAAGCPKLERFTIQGWQDIKDDNIIPIIHFCTQLKYLNLRGVNITIKSCREAALSLPFLQTIDVSKCGNIKEKQIWKLRKDFEDVEINF